ncbi:hypothetical protein [Martelella sp. UBA3392]
MRIGIERRRGFKRLRSTAANGGTGSRKHQDGATKGAKQETTKHDIPLD